MNTASRTDAPAIEATGLHKRFGATEVLRGVDLAVQPGAVVALLGPSGCGKTTLLRTIAGLERPDAGEVRLADRTVAGPNAHVPPEKRQVGMVFQDWALFPHLRVAQNVGYGLRGAERRGPRVAEVLDMVGLAGMGERQPATLSGGQQQRVALARALAPRPNVLLLDEPFSNLDTALRVQVRSEVHHLLVELGMTTVFVTHDQEEAFVLGDEVAVMHDGHIIQQAPPAELYARPASPWVARFVGDANLVAGDVVAGRAATPLGTLPLDAVPGGAPPGRDGGRVQVLVRPEELRLEPAGSGAANATLATVELHEYYGHDTVYLVRPDGAPTVRVRAGSAPRFGRGDRVAVRYVGPPAIAYPAPAGVAAAVSTSGSDQPDEDAVSSVAAASNGGDSAHAQPGVAVAGSG